MNEGNKQKIIGVSIQGSYANFGIQNPDFILTKKSVYPDFQKPIKRPGDGVWP